VIVDNEFERMWKEKVWPDLRYSGFFIEGLRKIAKGLRRVDTLAEIRSRRLRNKRQI
jgi:hypothetical protein